MVLVCIHYRREPSDAYEPQREAEVDDDHGQQTREKNVQRAGLPRGLRLRPGGGPRGGRLGAGTVRVVRGSLRRLIDPLPLPLLLLLLLLLMVRRYELGRLVLLRGRSVRGDGRVVFDDVRRRRVVVPLRAVAVIVVVVAAATVVTAVRVMVVHHGRSCRGSPVTTVRVHTKPWKTNSRTARDKINRENKTNGYLSNWSISIWFRRYGIAR